MTASEVIDAAGADGVSLSLSSNGKIKVFGAQKDVNEWRPLIRENKSDIIMALRSAANETGVILAWLAHIGETDEAIISEVLSRCRHDADAREYFIGRAAERGKLDD